MSISTVAARREFKVWMVVSLGLIKDGKMGVSIARAERIKTALAYAKGDVNECRVAVLK